jgi:hypothetical protein
MPLQSSRSFYPPFFRYNSIVSCVWGVFGSFRGEKGGAFFFGGGGGGGLAK